jgi:hypothetical protein
MATAPVETWAFWAPFTYGLLCVLTGYIASELVFPAIERASYRASKRLDPRSWPTVVQVVDELVAHSLLPAFGRCILVSSFYGAAVVMNLGRDETHFGGASRVSSNRVVPRAERVARCYASEEIQQRQRRAFGNPSLSSPDPRGADVFLISPARARRVRAPQVSGSSRSSAPCWSS